MKFNLAILAIALFTTSAFADGNGVERALPKDAHNVKIASAALNFYATGLKKTSEGNIDGPVYENTYTQMLLVTVTYQSQDDQDVAQRIEGESDLSYDPTPTVSFELSVSDAEIAAIQANKLDPRSLVEMSVSQKDMPFDKAVYTAACVYNNESGAPENEDTCVKHETITESRPVLVLSRK